ncbi:MAG: hypothetical protein QM691_11755 [Opitutaceae bacterium]
MDLAQHRRAVAGTFHSSRAAKALSLLCGVFLVFSVCSAEAEPRVVDFRAVVADPASYNGVRIHTTGIYVTGFEVSKLVSEPTRRGFTHGVWLNNSSLTQPDEAARWLKLYREIERLSRKGSFWLAEVEVVGVIAHKPDAGLVDGFGHLNSYPTEFRLERLLSYRVLESETVALERAMDVEYKKRERIRAAFTKVEFPNGTSAEQVAAVLPYTAQRERTTNRWRPDITVDAITYRIPFEVAGADGRRKLEALFSVDLYNGVSCDCYCRLTDRNGTMCTISGMGRGPILGDVDADLDDLLLQVKVLARTLRDLRRAAKARGVDLAPNTMIEVPRCVL